MNAEIKVHQEPDEFKRCEAENCTDCKNPTRTWLDAHTPLCQDCAYRRNTGVQLNPVSKWGRRSLYQAKVGTLSSSLVVVNKDTGTFKLHSRIEFAELNDMRGSSKNLSPRWRDGIIWKIEDNRLYIDLS